MKGNPMRRILSLLTVFVCMASQAVTTVGPFDQGFCQLRFYGTLDGANGPIGKDELLRSGPVFDTQTYSSLARQPIDDPKYKRTYAGSGIQTKLGDTDSTGMLYLQVEHAVQVDAQGTPVKAVQKTCLMTAMYKNGNAATSIFTDSGCGAPVVGRFEDLVQRPGSGTGASISSNTDVDPFAPNSGWEEVKIVNGIPELKLSKTVYLETPSGSGIMKAMCQSFTMGSTVHP
jgi:hypothetical protein